MGQVGAENRPKIDQKRHRINDGNKNSIGTAKKSQCEAATPKNPGFQTPGSGLGGGINPSLEGKEGIGTAPLP